MHGWKIWSSFAKVQYPGRFKNAKEHSIYIFNGIWAECRSEKKYWFGNEGGETPGWGKEQMVEVSR